MNLPFSWFGVGAAASPKVLQAVGSAVQSTSQYFGDLLSAEPTVAANGLSASAESKPTLSARPAKSLASLQRQLSDWLKKVSKDQAIPLEPGEVSIEMQATGLPRVEGPEPVRMQLQEYISGSPELRHDLQQAYQSTSGGLDWLPGMSNSLPFRLRLPVQ